MCATTVSVIILLNLVCDQKNPASLPLHSSQVNSGVSLGQTFPTNFNKLHHDDDTLLSPVLLTLPFNFFMAEHRRFPTMPLPSFLLTPMFFAKPDVDVNT